MSVQRKTASKPVFQPKKWTRHAAQIKEADRKWNGLRYADWTLDLYLHPEHLPPLMPPIADRVTLYLLMQGEYRAQLEMQYICGQTAESLQTVWLFAAAGVRAYQLADSVTITNPAAAQSIRTRRTAADTVCALIAANEWNDAAAFAEQQHPLLAALLRGDDTAARRLLEAYPDSMDEAEHQWGAYLQELQARIHEKQIWLALLDGDAARMQAAMETHIRSERSLPWDYTPLIDLMSVAQIKLAVRRGLSVGISVIEIPAYYLDLSHRIDRNVTQLPEVPEKI